MITVQASIPVELREVVSVHILARPRTERQFDQIVQECGGPEMFTRVDYGLARCDLSEGIRLYVDAFHFPPIPTSVHPLIAALGPQEPVA